MALGSGALTLFLFKILKDNGNLYTLDISKQNQRRAQKQFLDSLTKQVQKTT